jgi:ABC-type transporter Mla maintaining outer membrane lipid asymmetry ATPase subunit MlaF
MTSFGEAPPPPDFGQPSRPSRHLSVAQGAPGLTLDRVDFDYAGHVILSAMDFELDKGASAVVTGQNGCGKSTLLYVAAGLIAPKRGAVLHAGNPLGALFPSARVQRGIRVGFVFQEGGLLANLDAISNVSLALRYHYDVLDLDETAMMARAEAALEAAQVSRADWSRQPAHLSFGIRKRLALARALAIKPNFFFFDDPDVGLDPRTAQVTHQILCQLRDDPEVTLLVATNRPQLIERLEVPGYRLHSGLLTSHSGKSSLPPSGSYSRVPG